MSLPIASCAIEPLDPHKVFRAQQALRDEFSSLTTADTTNDLSFKRILAVGSLLTPDQLEFSMEDREAVGKTAAALYALKTPLARDFEVVPLNLVYGHNAINPLVSYQGHVLLMCCVFNPKPEKVKDSQKSPFCMTSPNHHEAWCMAQICRAFRC
jgi:hypothetical protein